MQTELRNLLQKQREYFDSGETRPCSFRSESLAKLLKNVKEFELQIQEALKLDLGKNATESYLGEIGITLEETSFAIKNLEKWSRPERVSTPFTQWPGKSLIYSEPLGQVLIIGPWNYPFQLLLTPLVGAIAAGNCAIVKPSELAPHTSAVVQKLLSHTFPTEFVATVAGGVDVSQILLQEKWGHIFFTGGATVGRVVMRAAAEHLTPVTLELGGKSPCIIDESADLKVTARRIAWGKFFNAGQTCVAPDYLLVPKTLKLPLIEEIKTACDTFFGKDPASSSDYARIINARHFERLCQYLRDGKAMMGGTFRKEDRYLSPTLLVETSMESKVMQEEIFGPILPVLEYNAIEDAISIVQKHPHPLALYLFTKNSENEKKVLESISFGGGCINDTLVHLGNPRLPFGGVGNSGIGRYHGKYTFDTFSHKKSVLKKKFFADLKLRYPPYEGKLDLLKKLIGS